MKKRISRFYLLLFVALTLFSSRSFAQSTSGSTERKYWGFDLGGTYNWYSGGSNFFYPVVGTEPDGASVFARDAFNSLGHGVGYLFGFKVGRALSNLFDLEAKLRYLTNYSSNTENQAIRIGIQPGVTVPGPVINSYNLLLGNLEDDLLAHLKISERCYATGGVSFSGLLSDRVFVSQIKNGGPDWEYTDRNTGKFSGDTSLTVTQTWSDFFANFRFGLIFGGGTILPIGIGSTVFDAELLVSIPLTSWLQGSGEDLVSTNATNLGLPSVTFPKLWYASLTIGVRFPFGGFSKVGTSTGGQ